MAAAAERYEMDYESRSFLAFADERHQLFEVLLAASSGAALVFGEAGSAGELGDILADAWITHVFCPAEVLAQVDIEGAEDLLVAVLTSGHASDVPALAGDELTIREDPDPWSEKRPQGEARHDRDANESDSNR
jgi:hypothetical protein